MIVVDASTSGLVSGWLDKHPGVAHRYQFGEATGAGLLRVRRALSGRRRRRAPRSAPDDAFAVISTAAVDVVPRGAALTHANILTANLTAIGCIGYTPEDRYLVALPLFHVTALGGAMAHMHAGGALVIVSRFDADEAVRLIDRHRVTHVSDFPPVLDQPARRRQEGGQPAAEPPPRLGPRRAGHDPATARGDGRQVLDGVRPVRDERVRHAPARVGAARRVRAASCRPPR